MNNNFKIKGHSGCKIEINDNLVTKTAKDAKYSDRLYLQMVKQNKFRHDNKYTGIKTSKVHDYGYVDENKFWFSMELIPYKTFDEFILLNGKSGLVRILDSIFNFIDNNIQGMITVDSKIFTEKFEKTKKMIFNKHQIDFEWLNKVIYDLPAKMEIPKGYCHGDFTFSNMLFGNDDIILIDFLDTFLDSPLQDIVKLRQDTRYKWSLNFVSKVQDSIKVQQALSYIDKILCDKYNFVHYKEFQILNLLRIIPYSYNKNHINNLNREITNLCLH